ncbi:arginyl-tRNA synthetase [Streptomyces sp. CB00455]|uniref:ArgS-related anticodon-binding protein NrtL n=1 Tax=Streptomyces sp. CB00455 TaxID=1703927 RepID=UPI00093B1A06|nr:arginine--tRNA ligase [Streptomyces sp. CB00455]OKK20598.1 arginyl-tRNA synthetase [Streptomyces sp. CB00455]
MNPADLPRAVVRALRCAVEGGELGGDVAVPGRVVVERTRPGGVGEYASPVAFQIAKAAGMRPADVARVLARRLAAVPGIERVEVTGAGFVNFVLPPLSAPLVIRGLPGSHPRLPTEPLAVADDARGLRERLLYGAVARILQTQPTPGREQTQPPPGREQPQPPPGHEQAPPLRIAPIAPIARRDGDVVARFGADAVRWAVLSVPARETPEFSPLLLVQSEDSEFFRVRYAFARSRALLRGAADLGFAPAPADVPDAPHLLRVLADHPLVLEAAAHHRAPERLTRHLVELADAALDFQYRVLPRGDEKPSAAHRARLALAEAAGSVLAGGLALLGMDAPERL